MANKKVEEKVTKKVEPTRADIKAAAFWLAKNTELVPTFVGPTASGKTWLAHEMAREFGEAKLVTILLQQDTPEEVAGFQAKLEGVEKLSALTPYWFDSAQEALNEGRNVIIFFDELGLAHEATRGAIYTFLRNREIRGKHLTCKHAEPACSQCLLVLAAMNPADLAPAMLTRIAQLHVPVDRNYLLNMSSTSLAKRIAQIAPISNDAHAHTSNRMPDGPTVYTPAHAAVVNKFDRTFWGLEEATRLVIASSVLPSAIVEEVMREDSLSTPSISEQIRRPELIVPIMKALDVPAAVANAKAMWDAFPSYSDFKEVAPALAQLEYALVSDENKMEAWLEAPENEETASWFSGLGEAGAQIMKEELERTNLFNFNPTNPSGALLDAMLLQCPPDQNELVHMMSDEARDAWKKKYGVKD